MAVLLFSLGSAEAESAYRVVRLARVAAKRMGKLGIWALRRVFEGSFTQSQKRMDVEVLFANTHFLLFKFNTTKWDNCRRQRPKAK